MKQLIKLLGKLTLLLCIGMSVTQLANAAQPGSETSSTKPGDFDASQFKLDMMLAKRGDPDAQYYVGNAYEEGRGTQKDLAQAFVWYSKAAQQNQPEAQYKLGYFYEHGLGVKQDMNKAMSWYKLATKTSHGTVRARLNKEAFAQKTAEQDQTRAAMKREQERKQVAEQERERQRKLIQEREHERQRKLAEQRVRHEAERKAQQKAAVQSQKIAMASASKPLASERVHIPDLSGMVLNNKWHDGTGSADYLPSSSTHCLRDSDNEIVCFSDEKQRVIKGQRVTYTTKATLSNFKSDGTFQIKYYYNAIEMGKASSPGVSVDPNGLQLVQGWQEPQLAIHCRTSDRVNLYCDRGNIKLHYWH
jgi:hypothetical protein